jgi:anti-sigma-K factor RskA
MTAADLLNHRVEEAEKTLTGHAGVVRSLEREVDRLKIEAAAFISAVSKLEGELTARDEFTRRSIAKLHDRLDEELAKRAPAADLTELKVQFTRIAEEELREQGARVERHRLWKAWIQITTATVAVLGLVAAIVFGLAQAL